MEDVRSLQHLNKYEGSVDELVETYNIGTQSIINHHVPFCYKIISLVPKTPWYFAELRSAKKSEETKENLAPKFLKGLL